MLERHLPGGCEGGAHAQLARGRSASLADLHQQLASVEEAAAGVINGCSIAFPLDLVELAEPAPSTSGSEGTTVRALPALLPPLPAQRRIDAPVMDDST